jgi:superfamily II DNA or RNA helicase
MISGKEFIRNAFLIESKEHKNRFETVYLHDAKETKSRRIFCSCDRRKTHATCRHADDVAAFFHEMREPGQAILPDDRFKSSIWHRILNPAICLGAPSVSSLSVRESGPLIEISGSDARPAAVISGDPRASNRLLRRLGYERRNGSFIQAPFLEKLREFVLSDVERLYQSRGMISSLIRKEDCVWQRIAYHCFMESCRSTIALAAAIHDRSGDLAIRFSAKDPGWSIEAIIPRPVIAVTAAMLPAEVPASCTFKKTSAEQEILFRIERADTGHWALAAGIVIDNDGVPEWHRIADACIYGQTAYLPPLKTLFPLSQASSSCLGLRLHAQPEMDESALSGFIERHIEHFSLPETTGNGPVQADLFGAASPSTNLRRIVFPPIVRSYSSIELEPVSLNEQECRARVSYVKDMVKTDMARLRQARGRALRFIFQDGAVIDTFSNDIVSIAIAGSGVADDGSVAMPRSHLLGLAGQGMRISLAKNNRFSDEITRLIEIRPMSPLRKLKGFRPRLREYQKRAVEWLLFLYDNSFGGLLCDEMGLGKTHEALGAIIAARQQRDNRAPALIVCPATVISHWQRIVETYATDIDVAVYRGALRSIPHDAAIVITSYGIIRNDTDILSQRPFGIVVFDEIQNLKNPGTGYHEAASRLAARCRIGLSGTPIENSVSDLKSLFDIVLPGYLGMDAVFLEQFLQPIESNGDSRAKKRLRCLTAPFIMRRMKNDVLGELPEKIESHYECALHAGQEEIYRRVLAGEAREIVSACKNPLEKVPYMHVFHVINKLKQLCDHPAVYLKSAERYAEYGSGKFDLFLELLSEALGAGEKVAVFSQYLRMIEIIGLELSARNVGHVILTGGSADRGGLVQRFNDDPRCRVFVGSLKAGGTGIDLTAASVLIHYDRWWNAAREDQATDRVHRIGQKKAVQIIKMTTVHTIEERIGRIIDRKRKLTRDTLHIDDPKAMKSFSREELIELLEERPAQAT